MKLHEKNRVPVPRQPSFSLSGRVFFRPPASLVDHLFPINSLFAHCQRKRLLVQMPKKFCAGGLVLLISLLLYTAASLEEKAYGENYLLNMAIEKIDLTKVAYSSQGFVNKAVSLIPERPQGSPGGLEFMESTRNSIKMREIVALKELISGNIPSFLKRLKPVFLYLKTDTEVHKGIVWVMPDYLSIGSDDNFVRIPVTPMTAQTVANRFGFCLPTTKLVDEIYLQADIQIPPKAFP
ncbi:MAG: hypothetical protein HQK54_07210, partial [Oligoflexales bacterium]|nr:hypothetical protein [Oligoflexales bacterium]